MNSLIKISGNEISCNVSSVADAKIAIKEAKILKKELKLSMKAISLDMKALRFEYSQKVKSRGSMVRGGHGVGKFIRGMQSISRNHDRANLAKSLQPLEQKKVSIDSVVSAIDELTIKLEYFAAERQK